ncbi:MAG: YjbH domain-containing protein [Betaproteobacteria bacterium]|nr:YjbH domain-containing protein [Betaproteobacteria bacterium]
MAAALTLSAVVLAASAIHPGEHLSDWLLRQPDLAARYPAGLSWQVPEERPHQAALRDHLTARLWTGAGLGAPEPVRAQLAGWLKTLPVTGRVPLRIPDARWLQAHPESDPVLEAGQSLQLPVRPVTVTVLLDGVRQCHVPFSPGGEAGAYLKACSPMLAAKVDRVWIIQPDGHVQSFGVAGWNAQAQDPPAPGAWIWAPGRDSTWPESFSRDLAAFLATQGPDDTPPDPSLRPVVVQPPQRDPAVTANDWGQVGLMQTPTARMAPAGDVRTTYSHVHPYDRLNVFLQPFDWLEAGFRYTNIDNRLYGAATVSGSQTYKDKSVDFKLRLREESALWPELALGMTDIGGTGLFSSEYLVGSKRSGAFDWSLGLAWGYLGSSDNVKNPFTWLSPSYAVRNINAGQGGNFNGGGIFHGSSALFGGVQYQTPWDPLILKFEYDGNSYQHEPLADNQTQRYPFNAGLVYRYSPALDFSAGWERGNMLMLGLSLHTNLATLSTPKFLDPPLPKVSAPVPLPPHVPAAAPDWIRTVKGIEAQTQWRVESIRRDGSELEVRLDQAHGLYFAERLERALTVLNHDAPADITRFRVTVYEDGLLLTSWVALRAEWVAQHARYRPPSEMQPAVAAVEPWPKDDTAQPALWQGQASPFQASVMPSFISNFGGPNSFLLYQVGVATPAQWRLSDRSWVDGLLNLRLVDNYSLFTFDSQSELPHVRTYIREYLTTSRVTMPNLQFNHADRISENQYVLGYAGYLESMFAGVGGEWLYRPWNSSLAFGVDVNRVQQRGFAQDFSLRDYGVVTGHATLYWDTGWQQTHVNLSVGQYLAGDRGVTLDMNRQFDNGVAMGVFATKTNVTAAQFGEGSFDKGIYVNIPFDAMLPASTALMGSFLWDPLIRDGGARLARTTTLYDLTSARNHRSGEYASAGSSWWRSLQDNKPSDGPTFWSEVGDSGHWLSDHLVSQEALAPIATGGLLVLGSALLDRPLWHWAQRHTVGRWAKLGSAANAVPYALALGSGMLWMGLGDQAVSNTAQSALLAAGWTYGLDTLVKMTVNRTRPLDASGIGDFGRPFGKGSGNSSFPSNHVAVATALVTPFAQQYNAPVLYLLSAATAFGRVQSRQHFLSDTVAGGLIGYGMGSLMLARQRSRWQPEVSLGVDRSAHMTWHY